MPEPHASTAAGALAGAGFAAPWWLYGADPGALIFGMIAATFISFGMAEISSKARSACAVGLAGLLAGFGARPVLAGIVSYYPAFEPIDGTVTLLGILIGVFAPTLVPLAISAAGRLVGRVGA